MAPFVRDPAALAAEPTFVSAQRWGRAFVGSPLGIDCMARAAARMAVCGDFCGGSTMESSWCSGEAAADVVVGMLDKGGCSLDD